LIQKFGPSDCNIARFWRSDESAKSLQGSAQARLMKARWCSSLAFSFAVSTPRAWRLKAGSACLPQCVAVPPHALKMRPWGVDNEMFELEWTPQIRETLWCFCGGGVDLGADEAKMEIAMKKLLVALTTVSAVGLWTASGAYASCSGSVGGGNCNGNNSAYNGGTSVNGNGNFNKHIIKIGNGVGNGNFAQNNQSGVNNGVNVLGNQTAGQTNINFGN
jgi:hypothetical protein